MAEKREILLVESPAGGGAGRLSWLFSRNQLELVQRNLAVQPAPAVTVSAPALVDWQGLRLPLVSLEGYYGLVAPVAAPTRYLFLKGAGRVAGEVQLAMIVVPIHAGMRLGASEVAGVPVAAGPLQDHGGDIHGIYALADGGLAVVPDVWRIAARCRADGQNGAWR